MGHGWNSPTSMLDGMPLGVGGDSTLPKYNPVMVT